ncbi:HDOD domain-containing protein [Oligoflexia bacterium]|nr:HDOD domain-containing protein [Oligoflexia bacterium]
MESEKRPVENRRLQRALEHVNRLWFPVNNSLFSKIQEGLKKGSYDLGMEFLVEDIKKDFALYTYCLRELALQLQEEGVAFYLKDPIEFLEFAGLERIKKVFSVDIRTISEHNTTRMTPFQAKQFEATVVSASTAEVLAQKTDIDPNSAYFTALLRQLGLTLVAWNYPSVYEEALSEQTATDDLDTVISEKLGFSPILLAMALIEEWNPSSELEEAVSAEDTQGTLGKICRIGEALARANQPETYPSALSDWQMARSAIEASLGVKGFKTIQSYVQEYSAEYHMLNPELFDDHNAINPELHIHHQQQEEVLNKNRYLEQCLPVLKNSLKDFYANLPNFSNMHESISYLISNVFPGSGFNGLCIYTADTKGDTRSATLVPRLKIGKITAEFLHPVACDQNNTSKNPVSIAFAHVPPIRGHIRRLGVSYVASRLRESMGGGVLYVELPEALATESEALHVIHFKAVRQAFVDIFESC